MIVEILLIAAGIHLLCGLAFAVPFVLVGVGRIDPHAMRGSAGFRILIIPGTALFWPLLAWRWLNGVRQPPEENNPHRRAARNPGAAITAAAAERGNADNHSLSPVPNVPHRPAPAESRKASP